MSERTALCEARELRKLGHQAVTEGVNLKYVERMRQALYGAADRIEELESQELLVIQSKWRSQPEIMRVLDEYDDYTSMLSQAYAHSKAEMPPDLLRVLQLGTAISLRARSHFQEADRRA